MQETKENRDECKRLLKLCSNQAFFPSDAGIRKLLVDSLLRSTKTQEHAERCIMRWIEKDSLTIIDGHERSTAPTVPDIIRLAASVNPSNTPLPSPCEDCRALGGRVVVEFRETKGIFAGEMREGVRWCDCERGQAMKAADPRLNRVTPIQASGMQSSADLTKAKVAS